MEVMKITSSIKIIIKRKWWTPAPHQHPASTSWYELRTSTTSTIWIRIRFTATVPFFKRSSITLSPLAILFCGSPNSGYAGLCYITLWVVGFHSTPSHPKKLNSFGTWVWISKLTRRPSQAGRLIFENRGWWRVWSVTTTHTRISAASFLQIQ